MRRISLTNSCCSTLLTIARPFICRTSPIMTFCITVSFIWCVWSIRRVWCIWCIRLVRCVRRIWCVRCVWFITSSTTISSSRNRTVKVFILYCHSFNLAIICYIYRVTRTNNTTLRICWRRC